jgi:2-oxoglutarate ferredoxin oxidoreductase subunit alpha
MTDGEVGHLREKVVIPEEDEMELIDRVPATISKDEFIPFTDSQTRDSKVPDFPTFGTGYRTYVTGLTHNEKGFPATDKQPDHERLVMRIITKITDDREKLTDVEEIELDDAQIAFVTYGASARPTETAVSMARQKGIKAGMLRLKLVWPFPRHVITDLSKKVNKIIVPEMNLGQIYHSICQYAHKDCEILLAPKIGGEMHLPDELFEILEGAK